ncbi:MAG: aldo/keto reductase [Actinomyces sp.]|nr:aldo/keto reductase [Actinomyces sp.]
MASGFLTGKYHRGDKLEGDRAGMVAPYVSAQAFDVVDAVTRIARDKDVAPAAVALAWLIAQPTIAAPLASARNLGQLEGIMQASSVELSQEEIDELTRLSDGL